jgi:FkbM family methyltransferase
MLWRALKDVDNGFYIDIGAQDPVVDSVSLAFYEHGWRGINVEPNSYYAEMLRTARPDEVVEQAAISNESKMLMFFEFPNTGLSTADSVIAHEHLSAGFEMAVTTVPSISVDDLLKKHATYRPIHWMKIDVEGFEKQVLESWRYSEIRPWIVVVESTKPLSQALSHREWEALILAKDYKFVYFDGLNRFYIHESQKKRRSSFKLPPNIFDDFFLSGKASQPFHRLITAEVDQQKEDLKRTREALSTEVQRVEQVVTAQNAAIARAEKAETEALAATTRAKEANKKVISVLAQANQAVANMRRETARANHAEANVNRETARAAQAEARAASERAQLQAVQATLSWRITRPLRGVRRIIQGDFGPVRTVASRVLRDKTTITEPGDNLKRESLPESACIENLSPRAKTIYFALAYDIGKERD